MRSINWSARSGTSMFARKFMFQWDRVIFAIFDLRRVSSPEKTTKGGRPEQANPQTDKLSVLLLNQVVFKVSWIFPNRQLISESFSCLDRFIVSSVDRLISQLNNRPLGQC
jgi:hypothetical protein